MRFNLNNPAFLQSAGSKLQNIEWGEVFRVTAVDNVTLKFSEGTKYGTYRSNIEYSMNNITFDPLPESIELKAGKTIGFKTSVRMNAEQPIFTATGRINIAGNMINAVTEGFHSGESNLFKGLFKGLPVVDASELVFTSSYYGALDWYYELFMNCTNLVYAPKEIPISLRGNNVSGNLLQKAFYGCTSLISSPLLNAQSITSESIYSGNVFEQMFYGCSSLQKVTIVLGWTPDLSKDRFSDWLYGVPDTGTFITNITSRENWQDGASGIPTGWTVQDYAG